jgi:ketosteroid isomerase-like protein
MSEQNTEAVIRSAYEAFQRGDMAAVLDRFADDVVWETPTVRGIPFSGLRRGKAAVAEVFRLLAENEDVEAFEQKEFIVQGERAAVLGRYRARVKATGRVAETPWIQVFTVRGGKIASFYEIYDTAVAERAYEQSTTA